MNKTKALAVLNVISFIIHVAFSYMTQSNVINQKNVGEVSDTYPSLFTPAGFTFAIWGIIYTSLGIFCVYHMVMAYKRNENAANRDLRSIGALFILNNIATALWLIAWTREQLVLSVLLIIFQLMTLIVIHQRLHIHTELRSPGSKLATELPLSIYLGWISIATIANIASWLVATRWDGFGYSPTIWTGIMLVVAIILGVFMVLGRRNIAFGLVVIWGLFGIRYKLISEVGNETLQTICLFGIGALAIATIFQAIRSISQSKKVESRFPAK